MPAKLPEEEIWSRVKRLSKETVYTIDTKQPYEIKGTTNEIIVIENRDVRPHRGDVYRVYLRLHEDGYVATDNMPKGIVKPGQSLRIILAILVALFPDEIEVFTKGRIKGIRFREVLSRSKGEDR